MLFLWYTFCSENKIILFLYFHSATSGCVDLNLRATPTEKYIQSPNYPDEYESNANCRWLITSDAYVAIQVMDIDVEYCCDDAILFDGINDSSREIEDLSISDMNETFTSSGPAMYIRFTSDSSLTKRGFRLRYYLTESGATVDEDDGVDNSGDGFTLKWTHWVNIARITGSIIGAIVSVTACACCW